MLIEPPESTSVGNSHFEGMGQDDTILTHRRRQV